jgi:two-component system invasion response regulator UvrY
MPTVTLIDDHPLFRTGLRSALSLQPSLVVASEASDAVTGRRAVEQTNPDVVVLDLSMPGGGGLGLGRELLSRRPETKILILTACTDASEVGRVFAAGMLGYASKTQPISEVVEAIHEVANGRRYVAPGLSAEAAADSEGVAPELRRLTLRERQVFALTVEGLSSRVIGTRLSISPRTVETHRARILHKLDAHNVVDLVRIASRLGMLDAAPETAKS